MSDIKSFLKVCQRYGYPNPKLDTLANMVDYNLDNFLPDLKAELGEEGVLDFCDKAIKKITGKKGLKVDVDGPKGDEYCYIYIYPKYYDEDESETDIISGWDWGESKLLTTNEAGEEEYKTIQDIIDDTDMGEWGDLDEFLDDIKRKAYNIVWKNCGFGFWLE